MKNNNVIICEKCYEENEGSRTTCKNCNSPLYNNEKGTIFQKIYNEEYTQNQTIPQKMNNKTNKVANIIQIVAIITGFIGTFYGFTMIEDSDFAIPIIIASIVSAIFVYGFGEIIQLLEDIKNK